MKLGIDTRHWNKIKGWQKKEFKLTWINTIWIILLILAFESKLALLLSTPIIFVNTTKLISYNKWHNEETKRKLKDEKKEARRI